MAELQTISVLKDVVVPLFAAVIGAGGALVAGYFTVVKPQREQHRFEDASAHFETTAFFQAVHLAASTIAKNQPLGEMEGVTRQHIVRFIDTVSKLAVRLNKVLPNAKGNELFHLMIIELDRLGRKPVLDRHAVLFAYSAAATTGLLLGTADRNECTKLLATIENSDEKELAWFFRSVVDGVLPSDIRQEVRSRAST